MLMTYIIHIGCRHLVMKLSLFSEIYTGSNGMPGIPGAPGPQGPQGREGV